MFRQERERGNQPRSHWAACQGKSLPQYPGSVPSCQLTMPPSPKWTLSVLVFITPYCHSLLYSVNSAVSPAWMWAPWASSLCLFCLPLYAKRLPTGGRQSDFAMTKVEVELEVLGSSGEDPCPSQIQVARSLFLAGVPWRSNSASGGTNFLF